MRNDPRTLDERCAEMKTALKLKKSLLRKRKAKARFSFRISRHGQNVPDEVTESQLKELEMYNLVMTAGRKQPEIITGYNLRMDLPREELIAVFSDIIKCAVSLDASIQAKLVDGHYLVVVFFSPGTSQEEFNSVLAKHTNVIQIEIPKPRKKFRALLDVLPKDLLDEAMEMASKEGGNHDRYR